GPFDVGRQRHASDRLQYLQHAGAFGKGKFEQRALAAGDVHLAAVFQLDCAARLRCATGPHVSECAALVQHALDEDFHLAAAGLFAEQPCGNHPCVVEDHQVSGFNQIEKVGKPAVTDLPRITVEVEQTTAPALGGGAVGNQFGG